MVTDVQIEGTDNTDYKKHGEVVEVKSQNKQKKVIVFLIFCFFVFLPMLAIVWAKSEGAIVGIIAGVLFLLIVYFGRLFKRMSTYLLFLLVSLVALVSLVSLVPQLKEKATFADLSGQIRLQQWHETWEMLKNGRLITGAGLANYQNAVKPYHQEGIFFNFDNDPNFRNNLIFGNAEYKATHWQPTEIYLYPHNFFLNFWSETGLLGLIVMLAILIKFFVDYFRASKEARPLYLVLISVMIAVLVHGLVDVQYFKNDLSVLFWMIIGASVCLKRKAPPVRASAR